MMAAAIADLKQNILQYKLISGEPISKTTVIKCAQWCVSSPTLAIANIK